MARWVLAGRHIGQDIMGTMTNILLFSYLSGSLAMVLIYLKCEYIYLHNIYELVSRNDTCTDWWYRY